MFETQVITDLEQFKNLREEWNRLLQRSYANTIFLTWEWLYAWWEVFGAGGKLFIVVVRDQSGMLVGLAPLFIRKTRYYKFPVREMAFIGMGLSDRQDFIISGENINIIDEIISKIQENIGKWDIVCLEQIPDDSLLAKKEFTKYFLPEIELSSLCPFIKLEGNWETYFKSIKRDFRTEIRNRIKKLNEIGNWEFKVDRKPIDVEMLINSIKDIEQRSRKMEIEKDLLSSFKNRAFLSKVCNFCTENNWLDFSTLRIAGKLVAYSLGFIYNETHYGYNTAYDKEFFKLSPGKIVINEKIKWFFENKYIIKVFDFSRGDSQVKCEWTSAKRRHLRIVFFNKSFYTNLIRLAVFRIRPLIKRFMKKGNMTSNDQN